MQQHLEFSVRDDVLLDFPDMHVLALRAYIPDQQSLRPALEVLRSEVQAAIAPLRREDPLTSLPEIACWREAYGTLGVKPSKYPSSIEALLRRAKKGDLAETGIPVVDLYNMVSVKKRVPLGAYDIQKLDDCAQVQLRRADPDKDHFIPLGGRPDGFPLNPKLVVYAQGSTILCWGFNTRDSAATGVDHQTSDIVFFSETTVGEGFQRACAALSDLASKIETHGGTVGHITTVSSENAVGRV